MFLAGMGGAIFCTVLFAFGGMPLFTLAWVCNRAVQSVGWAGIVRMSSRWFSFSVYGAVMGALSLSFLFGDFLSRLFLGQLISMGMGWRGVFFTAAATLTVIFIANLLLLKETPKEIGEPEPEANPGNVFGEEGQEAGPSKLSELLLPLLRNPMFWTVCALSFGFTIVRETFNTWTPEHLHEVIGMEEGAAAKASSFFPLFGGISVLLAGRMSDRLGSGGRAAIILFGLLLSIPALLMLGFAHLGHSAILAVIVLGLIAFVMIGPYSFLAGAISLDFGGKKASATACGWIDGIGYLGGIFAGKGIGDIAEKSGWGAAFGCLAIVAAFSCLFAAFYWIRQKRVTV